jgi:hypothetical protein
MLRAPAVMPRGRLMATRRVAACFVGVCLRERWYADVGWDKAMVSAFKCYADSLGAEYRLRS